MEWHSTWEDPFTADLTQFARLLGDARPRTTFTETVTGSIAAGSLVCQRSAACSPVRATAHNGAQRSIRMATGERTKRSPDRTAEQLTAR